MDLLDDYIRQNSLTVERVLSEIDEWTLFCFYLDFTPELRVAYSSPLHVDNKPSFSVYESNNNVYEYLWKDSAKNIGGSIFKLISLLYGYKDYKEALNRVAIDFEIDLGKSEDNREKILYKEKPIIKPVTKIRIKSRRGFSKEGLAFWNSFYVTEELLRWKQVCEVEYVWYNDQQEFPFKCNSLTFAYPEYNQEIKEWAYQLYCPFEKEFKFRNDLKSNQVYGYNHLIYKSDTLVIAKSNKDILCLKLFGIESISPRSETTRIKDKAIEYFKSRYQNIIIFFDNDEPGINAALAYNLPSIIIPIETKCKDISDYLKMYGVDQGKELLHQLLGNYVSL